MEGSRREWRATVTAALAAEQQGVISRAQLRDLGITRFDVRSEVRAGRWVCHGTRCVTILAPPPSGRGRIARPPDPQLQHRWQAVFEAGAGARLDGVTALQQAGLTGWRHDVIDVSVPHDQRAPRLRGVRVRRIRCLEAPVPTGIPRARPEFAVIRAAEWARYDRQAATLIAMTVEQRLTSAQRLLATWQARTRVSRRAFLGQVIRDVCDGAQSLGELDFARLCRRYGLPEPDRQAVVQARGRRCYLDVRWTRRQLVVEVEGVHHALTANSIDDSLRQNALLVDGDRVLRIPVIGLRCHEREFMMQVAALFRG